MDNPYPLYVEKYLAKCGWIPDMYGCPFELAIKAFKEGAVISLNNTVYGHLIHTITSRKTFAKLLIRENNDPVILTPEVFVWEEINTTNWVIYKKEVKDD